MSLTETPTEEIEGQAAAPEAEVVPPSLGGGAAANDHKAVGSAYLGFALLFLVVGGVLALLMRAQLTGPDGTLLSDQEYRSLFTFHGTFSVFLFLLPAWVGLATMVVPLQIGAGRLAFPRLQTMCLWLTVVGGGLITATPFVPGAKRIISGWALSQPIPGGANFRGDAVEYLVLGIAVVLAATVAAAANLVVTIVKLRAPGLTARRMPLFSWSALVSGFVLLLALPVLIALMGMLYVDHHYGAQLFSGFTGSRGGVPAMWSRLFWFGAYPMLWSFVILALGVGSDALPVFAGRPIADRVKAMAALGAVGVLAFFGWGSEVTDLPRSRLFFAAGALVVLAPAASVLVNWLLTLRAAAAERGRDEVRQGLTATPMLFVLGMLTVLAAGLGASAVSAAAAGRSYHTDYWQVGQQHLMYFAPATLAIAAAAHFWGPKVWGRHLSPMMGKLEVLLLTGGAHLAFLPALVLGLQNMPVQASAYDAGEGWQAMNLAMSAGAAVFALGALVFTLDVLVSVAMRKGRPADPDPWSGHTLEWTAPTPLPRHNFDRVPEVRSATPALDLRAAGTPGTPAAAEEVVGA